MIKTIGTVYFWDDGSGTIPVTGVSVDMLFRDDSVEPVGVGHFDLWYAGEDITAYFNFE